MKLILSIIIKLLVVLSAIYGLSLTATDIKSFTYFTILSNIFVAIMILLSLIREIKVFITKQKQSHNNSFYIIKFMATISITLTFLVFRFILGPTMYNDIITAYRSDNFGSLYLHLIVPILSIIDFLVFDTEYKSQKKDIFYATIPPLAYTLFIIILSGFGMRWDYMYAPYNFLNYGAPTGWFGYDPSIANWDTLGIGVFYMLIFLVIIFIIIGGIFLKIVNRKSKY